MNYQRLGKSDLHISVIGFGCMSLKNSETENERLLHQAIDAGVNYFDTADLYDKGMNEKTVGKALKEKRQQLVIATKVGNQWREDGSGWNWNPNKASILSAVEESLSRLGTDYIDLYQLHGGTMEDPFDEIIEAFELLQHQGKIRYYGISSIRPNVIREYIQRSRIVSVMMQYSLLDRRPEESCFPLLQQNNIGIIVRGGVAQGLLVNKPPKPYLNYTAAEVKRAADAVQAVSGKNRSAAQTALRFVLQQPAVTAAVAGLRTMEQLEEAVQTFNTPAISEMEYQTLHQALPVNFYVQHR